ncbi:MAG TPA: T9SS type A sorting domain-containing protein [Bacteroidia bacterium]|nr:T9SS type A sorting domain-containing protein [Bacteroidia bacterium]HRH09616.1 T9SS type A sorting domain-containing protein [Bacteroidia bacterium]HRH63173.1 T9SS type A sorting domain-containing protein [Bacteroidia bacterium]
MKKIIVIVFLQVVTLKHSQAQNWQWAQNIHSNNWDGIEAQCKDALGNIYAGGYFNGSFVCFQNDTIFQAANGTTYYAKYDQNGNELWARALNYTASASCGGGLSQLVYDSISNSLLLSGSFCGSIDFNGTTIYSSINNDNEGFVAKLDLSGNLIWIKKAEGNGNDFISGVSYDAVDNIYICGTNTEPTQIESVNLPLGTFVAKLNSNGDLQWANNISGIGQYPNTVAFKVADIKVLGTNFYIIGGTSFDNFLIDTIQFNIPNSYGSLLSKFDTSGHVIWAKLAGYPRSGSPVNSLVLDRNENVYFISTYGDSAIFDNQVFYPFAGGDIDFVKYDKNGNFKWMQQTQCTNSAEGINVAIDANDVLYITGKFKGTAHFGNFALTSDNSIPNLIVNSYDAFLAAYDTSGICLGVENIPYAEGLSIVIDNSNSPILSGRYYGGLSLGASTFTASGPPDAFIAKHDAITGFKGFEKSFLSNQLLIQANPNSGKCTINIPEEFVNEKNLSLSIYNNKGQLIQRLPLLFNEGKIKLNLEAEAKGMYNAVLSNGSKNYSGKIIFE